MVDKMKPDAQRVIEAQLAFLQLAVILSEMKEEVKRGPDVSLYHIEKGIDEAFDTIEEFFEGDGK